MFTYSSPVIPTKTMEIQTADIQQFGFFIYFTVLIVF